MNFISFKFLVPISLSLAIGLCLQREKEKRFNSHRNIDRETDCRKTIALNSVVATPHAAESHCCRCCAVMLWVVVVLSVLFCHTKLTCQLLIAEIE